MMFWNRKPRPDLLTAARAVIESRENAFRMAFEALPGTIKPHLILDAIKTLPPGQVDMLHRELSDIHWQSVKVEGM